MELGGPNWNTIILSVTALVGAMTPILLALINKKASQTLKNSEETKQAAVATAGSVEKVHVAVNSERKAMTDEVRALREALQTLTTQNALLTERETVRKGDPARAREEAKADVRADARADARTLAKADEIAGRERDKPPLKPGWQENLPPDKAKE